ncbi:MAG: right-handed parallel beta-helix repeat-containing protein [Actinomycetota bacterium]|nr:right-handed parallel beta-helix repeat-containing protein [Actinomycetota bacterium]
MKVRGVQRMMSAALVVLLAGGAAAGCSGSTRGSAVTDPGESGATTTANSAATVTQPTVQVDESEFPGSLAAFSGNDVWVDGAAGDDGNDGSTREQALRTVDEAWQRIPAGSELTTGYRLRIVSGMYPAETLVNYWEDRHGTDSAPIIVEAADGAHTVTFEGDINMYGVSHFALIGIDIIRTGDAFHCELCDHVLIRDSELSGGGTAQEAIKINQSQFVYIENSDIHGAEDNAIDFVAVQYGHITGSRIHEAGDWCMYAKGGSAYLTVSGNEVYDCGTGGITAGQGTGFEFMASPWLQYEAYGIRILDNVIHDTEGAGLGVNGGYNVLLAGNTLYSVGTRSHVVEFVHGARSCDGNTDACTANHDAGGWGPGATGVDVPIPNRHVYFVNNIVVNPDGVQSQWQHFAVHGPSTPPDDSGAPSPSLADDDLRIIGNVIWNGSADMPLGVGDDSGCGAANPTCNESQLLNDNQINTWQPQLRDPGNGDYQLTAESAAARPAAAAVPEFVWTDAPAGVSAPAVWV